MLGFRVWIVCAYIYRGVRRVTAMVSVELRQLSIIGKVTIRHSCDS